MSTPNLDYSDWAPNYGDLPMEIILHIYRFLGYTDRRIAGACCRRWHAALDDKEIMDETQVRFIKVGLSDRTPPASEYVKSQLEIKNIYFDEVTVGYSVGELMRFIGRTAESMFLDNVDLTDKQFYSLVEQLPKLRELSVARCAPLFMTGLFMDANNSEEFITNLSGIKRLALRDCQYLTDAIFLRITQHIPILYALNLAGCPIAFHRSIFRRFYPNEGAGTPSESVLTFEQVYRVLQRYQDGIEEIDLSHTLIGTAIVNLCTLQFKRVYLAGCRQLVTYSVATFLQSQNNLQELDLSGTSSVNNDTLQCIVETNPQLLVLKVSGCLSITNEGAVHLAKLKVLRHLDISSCDGITTEGITEGIAREENLVIRELNISYLPICEECIKSVARNLTELRILNLNHCTDGATDEAVQCIIKYLRWLRELSLESCLRLTDAALTGIDVAKFEKQQQEQQPSTSKKASMNNFNPPMGYSLAEREAQSNSQKISLRSKAEDEIVRDATRKQALFTAFEEVQQYGDADFVGHNIRELIGLRALNLKGCNKISDVSLKYGLHFLELRHLLLSQCQQITFIGMEALVTNCPSIEEIDLSDCYNINDKTIQVLTIKLKRLRALHLSGCSQLTDHSLDAILVNCKCLQTLSVYRCRRMYTDIEDRLASVSTLRNLNMDNMGRRDRRAERIRAVVLEPQLEMGAADPLDQNDPL